ncbi:MAG: chemotaxis protein CheR [Sulfuricellaceae bacterium]|nr:chemotaxis protein CheR [Sulfuricellaceae bacterium]
MQPTLPAALLSRLSDVLAARLGLHYPAERWSDLERGIASAAPALGMADATSCAHRLLSAPLTHGEIEILASCLTVGETYFFREKPSFDVLEQHILPALLREREGSGRRLRIWSAGCCTGEEAYSIAMLLDRLIPNAEVWNITLLATDINPAFLRKAAEGEYGEWSFRSTPDWIKNRYFHPRRGSRFKLDVHIRKRVTFAYLNLADDAYPSLTNNTNAMDIIFCRNVLMYFSAERARRVVGNLHRALVDGGWLIVSPAETSGALFSRFTTVEFAGAILYRKDASVEAPRFVSHVPAPVTDSMQVSWRLSEENIPAENIPVAEALPEPIRATSPASDSCAPLPPQQNQLSCAARDCANQGRLGEAADLCRKAIAADKLEPAHHYLLSAILQEQGQSDDAAQSLMRALYLDPGFVLAHYALGNLRQSQGRRSEAQRHFDNALASLRAHPPDEILPESDGLAAGRLMEIILSMRSNMPQLTANT